MNIHKPKQHHVWRPRMSSDSEFNPFVRSTQPEASLTTAHSKKISRN